MTQTIPWQGEHEHCSSNCVYVPGLVFNSIMNCGGPSYFLKKPISDSALASVVTNAAIQLHTITKGKLTMEAIARKEVPDASTVQMWLDNGSINLKILEILKKTVRPISGSRTRRTSFVPLSSKIDDSHPDLSKRYYNPPDALNTFANQSSCGSSSITCTSAQMEDQKAADEITIGWPQESLEALNQWWCNGWCLLARFILYYVGGLVKNKKVNLF